MKIENTEVYGLERAIKTAKYPKAVNIEKTFFSMGHSINSSFLFTIISIS